MNMRNAARRFGLVLAAGLICLGGAFAQEPPPDGPGPMARPGEAIRQLGLSRDQLQQIRRLNMGRKPQMDAAQMRLRDANRALDEVIYGDNVSDAEFQLKLRELQAAQAEVARIRFAGELSVRRVLTPDQLVRFRKLRQRFEEERPPLRDPRGQRPGGADPQMRPAPTFVKKPIRN